ncbi:hypothetical protein ES288_D12G117500v1 [Gossypium darwinii]|nr:hypothetical protein ES288_D12G117500v1 [Gossypium darwinii]TYH38577.1 hypothetical protein ES332_D12G118600v1 [Gossypium tomentosum]
MMRRHSLRTAGMRKTSLRIISLPSGLNSKSKTRGRIFLCAPRSNGGKALGRPRPPLFPTDSRPNSRVTNSYRRENGWVLPNLQVLGMGMNDPTHPVHRTICGESGVWARVGLFMASLKIEARGERKRNWTIRISLDPAATEKYGSRLVYLFFTLFFHPIYATISPINTLLNLHMKQM